MCEWGSAIGFVHLSLLLSVMNLNLTEAGHTRLLTRVHAGVYVEKCVCHYYGNESTEVHNPRCDYCEILNNYATLWLLE